MTLFPMFLKLDGRPCLVVGAGTIAESKIESLMVAGASVTVVAPHATPKVESWHQAQRIEWKQRAFLATDLNEMLLVIAATNRQAVNHAVAEAARGRNVLCNSVDDPPDCDFYYPSVVQRGDLQIAVSTAGKSPSLAQRLRIEIDQLLPEDTGEWLDAVGEQRNQILNVLPLSEQRKKILHQLALRESCNPKDCPVQKTLDELLQAKNEIVESSSEQKSNSANPGIVYLVGAGPGNPDLLTVRARDLIASAVCLFHDDLVSQAILALAHAGARIVNVGKRCGQKSITQEEIHELMIAHARAGESVVRLKSGDPMLFGRATEEITALRAAGLSFEIVPGVTAGFAAAAAAGLSLTDRQTSSRAILMTRHLAADKTSSFAGLDPSSSLVLYMPGKDYRALQEELLASDWLGNTTCVLVSSASTSEEKIIYTDLNALSAVAPLPAPVVILILAPQASYIR